MLSWSCCKAKKLSYLLDFYLQTTQNRRGKRQTEILNQETLWWFDEKSSWNVIKCRKCMKLVAPLQTIVKQIESEN